MKGESDSLIAMYGCIDRYMGRVHESEYSNDYVPVVLS
jgi:hypothetical protein